MGPAVGVPVPPERQRSSTDGHGDDRTHAPIEVAIGPSSNERPSAFIDARPGGLYGRKRHSRQAGQEGGLGRAPLQCIVVRQQVGEQRTREDRGDGFLMQGGT